MLGMWQSPDGSLNKYKKSLQKSVDACIWLNNINADNTDEFTRPGF
jgi:hypothetical protein